MFAIKLIIDLYHNGKMRMRVYFLTLRCLVSVVRPRQLSWLRLWWSPLQGGVSPLVPSITILFSKILIQRTHQPFMSTEKLVCWYSVKGLSFFSKYTVVECASWKHRNLLFGQRISSLEILCKSASPLALIGLELQKRPKKCRSVVPQLSRKWGTVPLPVTWRLSLVVCHRCSFFYECGFQRAMLLFLC